MQKNSRMINLYEKEYYQEVLKRTSMLQQWIEEKKKMIKEDCPTDMRYSVQLDALDNYIVDLYEKGNLNKLNQSDLKAYLNILYKNSNDLYILRHSLLFSKQYREIFFQEPELTELKKRKQNAYERAIKIYQKIRNNEKVEEYDLQFLITYISGMIGYATKGGNNVLDNLFQYLLKKDAQKEHLSLVEKNFLIQMMSNYCCRKLDIPLTSVYLSDKDINGNELKNKNISGVNYGNFGVIGINKQVLEKELSKTKTLTPTQSMLFVISHENRHSYQSYHVHQPEANLAVFETIKSDLFRKELSTDEFDEYRKNYFFDGMENDANCWGYIFLEDVLHKNKIDKSMYEIEIDTNLINLHQQQTVGYKTNGNKKRQMEYFDVYHLSEIVKKRPEYVNEYPMLQIMFTKSGEVKPNQELFKGLIDKENHLDMDKYEVARDFVLKAMDQEIEKQQVEKMSTEEKFDYFIVVFTCLHQELKKLKNATRVIGKDERLVDAYQHIMPKRIKVVRKLLQEINKHAELIDDLASLERYGEYGRDLWMAERGIEDLINSIKSPIKESSEQIPSDIAVELLEVSQSEVKPNAARRGV